jgi:hypothetical protein
MRWLLIILALTANYAIDINYATYMNITNNCVFRAVRNIQGVPGGMCQISGECSLSSSSSSFRARLH